MNIEILTALTLVSIKEIADFTPEKRKSDICPGAPKKIRKIRFDQITPGMRIISRRLF